MNIIRFTASWCADCIVMRPVWKKFLLAHDNLKVTDYDFDDHEAEVLKYKIEKIPTTLLVDESGAEISRLEGMQDIGVLEEMITK
jgi:thiol-disulfide isomerase/thioredoxin